MTRRLLAEGWYRMRTLRPRLRSHVRLHRHEYRGQVWHVMEDRIGGKHQRFNPNAYRIIGLMDGRRSMDEIWQVLVSDLRDDSPTQDDVLRLLATLHAADLVQVDVTPDTAELLTRRGKQVRRKWLTRLGNPIGLKFPLFDPDRFLRWSLERLGSGNRLAAIWLCVVLPALLWLPSRWSELSSTTRDQLLAADNLLMLAILFPLVKIAHELSHGLVCRYFGGEVHEMGIMFLLGYPVPYVDASSSASFVGKWQRALVGAAGMLAEFFLAALAFIAWSLLEPGTLRGIAFNVIVLASVSTAVFNANPLLRFDGYYVLADLIEIPNLGSRANAYWRYLSERYVFGVVQAEPPQASRGERAWFVLYAPIAYGYRLFISLTIALLVATQMFFIGVAIAIWTTTQSVLWPMLKGLHTVLTGSQYAARSRRVQWVLALSTICLGLVLFALPVPRHTLASGVLWLPERAIVRAQSSGFIKTVRAQSGAEVGFGQTLIDMIEPGLAARIRVQQAKVDEARVQYDSQWGVSQNRAQQLEQQLASEQAGLTRLQDEARRLTLRAAMAGTFVVQSAEDLPGRFLREGEIVGYLRTPQDPIVKVVVTQDEVDPVRLDTLGVQIRLVQDTRIGWEARVQRSAPAAVRQLPSAVLGTRGGGSLQIDPRDDKGLNTLESVFEFDVSLPGDVPDEWLGSRVHVRFEHEAEPVAWRMGRSIRRLFLSRFST